MIATHKANKSIKYVYKKQQSQQETKSIATSDIPTELLLGSIWQRMGKYLLRATSRLTKFPDLGESTVCAYKVHIAKQESVSRKPL